MAKAKAKWWIPGQHSQNNAATASAAGTTSDKTAAEKEAQRVALNTADAKKFGLENFGNTCYANSVIQALYFCSPFRELIIQAPDSSVPAPIVVPPSPVVVASTSSSTPALPHASTAPPSPQPFRRKPERKQSSAGQPHTLATEDTPLPNGSHLQNGNIPSPTHVVSPSSLVSLPHLSSTPAAPIPIPPNPPSLFSALRSLYVYISTHPSEKGTVQPRAFIEKLKEVNEIFRSTTMHQDAHEFLNFLLNRIVEEVEEERRVSREEELSGSIATLSPTIVTTSTSSNSGTAAQDATLVHKLFEGVLTSETRCLTCETVSSRDESFLDLSIDIEQNSSVTACLRQFSASEMLCQKNKFFCDSCCDLQEAEKRMKIKKLPNVLALHLKRFKYQEDLQKYVKLAYRVAFPVELRLFNTVDDAEDADRLYELFAIVVHIGNGPHHGHYVSIIKSLGSWLVFDDVNVYPIAEADIPKYFGDPLGTTSNSGSAYVLYYQAKDIDLVSLGLRQEAEEISTNGVAESASATEEGRDSVLVNGTSLDVPEETPLLPPGLLVDDLETSTSSSEPLVPVPESNGSISIQTTNANGEGIGASSVSPKTSVRTIFDTIAMRRSHSTSGAATTTARGDGRKVLADRDALVEGEKDTEGINGIEGAGSPVDAREAKERRKEGKDKVGGWFGKRKSRHGDREKGGHGASASEHAPSSPIDPSSSPSSSWFKTAHHPSKDKARRAGEPVSLFDSAHLHGRHSTSGADQGNPRRDEHLPDRNGRPNGRSISEEPDDGQPRSFKVIRPKTSAGLVTPPLGSSTPGPINGRQSPVSRTASSAASSSGVVSASPIPDTPSEPFPPHVRQDRLEGDIDAPVLAARAGPRPLPPLPRSPEHHKSLSHLSALTEKTGVSSSNRPSTAGYRTNASSSPPPPVPALTVYQRDANRSVNGQADPGKGKGRDDGMAQNSMVLDNEHHQASAPVSAGPSTSSASLNFKRATRKLSLTAPMLGFGKREKDREKDKEKEKEKARERERERERQRDADHERDRQRDTLPAAPFAQFTLTPRF